MKRDIKFRGKELHIGEWVYGTYVYTDNNTNNPFGNVIKGNHQIVSYSSGDWNMGGWAFIEIDPETLGQYTGLKDKDGNEIYEGDIVELTIPDGSTRRFVVEFVERDRRELRPLDDFEQETENIIEINGWGFNWNGYKLFPSVIDGKPDYERMKVVGNIYENPDLIEDE